MRKNKRALREEGGGGCFLFGGQKERDFRAFSRGKTQKGEKCVGRAKKVRIFSKNHKKILKKVLTMILLYDNIIRLSIRQQRSFKTE